MASIDLGTNSCRLLICNESGECVYKDSIATKLGEGMYPELKFSEAAITRGVDSFLEFRKMLDKYNVTRYRAIATHACRVSLNAKDFIHQVRETSGIVIDVVDGYEEARLNLKGALLNSDKSKKYVVVYDLGGGSTEVTLATNEQEPKIIYTISIPWGARNSSEAFGLQNFDEQKAKKLQTEIKRWIDGFVLNTNLNTIIDDISFIATSSTPLRIIAFNENKKTYNREKVDGHSISNVEMDSVIEKTLKMTMEEKINSPYVGEKRASIFVASCVIFKTIYDGLRIEKLVASLKSAKDGIIEELLENGKTN